MALFNVVEDINEYHGNPKCFILVIDNWNDWWEYKTQFELYYINENGVFERVGNVKIADNNTIYDDKLKEIVRPNIPKSFDNLDNTFFH